MYSESDRGYRGHFVKIEDDYKSHDYRVQAFEEQEATCIFTRVTNVWLRPRGGLTVSGTYAKGNLSQQKGEPRT